VRQQLYTLTYSAGCSVQSGTLGTVRAIIAEGLARAAVLVHRRQPREHSQTASFRMAGIRRIVALRGDMPSSYDGFGEFRYASDPVAFIREETSDHFHMEVAAYPETHRCLRDRIPGIQGNVD